MTQGAAGATPPPPVRVSLFLPVLDGVTASIELHVDLVASENRHEVAVIGWRGVLIVLSDTYVSRDEAGEEIYLRVIDTDAGEERWSLLVASATLGWRAGEPLLTAASDGSGFTVHLLDRPEPVVTFGPGGTVTVR